MAKCRFELTSFYRVELFVLAICMKGTTSYAQQSRGFLSIDCGRTDDAYIDDNELSWSSDGAYIRTGQNSERFFKLDSTFYNHQALGDFRYFPITRNKHCYELPSIRNISYLIRAMFYYDAAKSDLLTLPIQFIVSINGTNWFTFTYSNQTDPDHSGFNYESEIDNLYVKEGIFYSPGSIIYFCLQPVRGVPFISSLELRPLDPEGIMYSHEYSKQMYLSNLRRMNLGPYDHDVPPIRYPDDEFDRLWYYGSDGEDYDYKSAASVPLGPNASTSVAINNVPAKVMLTAWDSNSRITDSLHLEKPVSYIYATMYFRDLNLSESGGTNLTFTLNGRETQVFNLTDRAIMRAYKNFITEGTEIVYVIATPTRFPIPILCALEIYEENLFDFSVTAEYDGVAVRALQASFNLNDWQGDPCTPVPYEWLSCESAKIPNICWTEICPNVWKVKTIALSNLNSSGFPHFIEFYDNLSRTLGSNSLDGLTIMYTLTEISITHSDVDNSIFWFFVNNFTRNAELEKLDFSYNAIKTMGQAGDWPSQSTSSLTFVNLSHNSLEGELSSFVGMPFLDTLQELDLSYNALTTLPMEWVNMTNLRVLDLSHNNLAGDISLLDVLALNKFPSLKELYISHNNLKGNVINNSVYLSSVTNLKFVNFDENQIQGTLELSSWQVMVHSNAFLTNFPQIFSFVNNNIMDINPKADALYSLLKDIPNFNQSGVLLGGNPYCKSVKSDSQGFFCRFRIGDPYVIQGKKKNQAILFSLLGGSFAFLVCCIFLLKIWSLSRKVTSLQKIQQALAREKVQPPLYSYNELKSASRDFHKDNKLGEGTFGIVFKGVLADGMTLAIKKLFNCQQEQVLNEFLHEVVLITGIKHRNLVQLKGCCIDGKQRILVYEHVENGNLAKALWGKKGHSMLKWQHRFNICIGVARGLMYLHEELHPRIIHRDIKPANILLDKNLNPKIADFGLARPFLDEQSRADFTLIAGTMGYWAPEYAIAGQLTDKADVFSFGTVVLEIVSGRKCIDSNMPSGRIVLREWAQELHEEGMLLDLLQPELRQNCVEDEVLRVINVALLCVQTDPNRRASMSQVVTMLTGNMDVTRLFSICNCNQPNFNMALAANEDHIRVMNMSSSEESDEETPLFYRGPALVQRSSTTGSIGTIELNEIIER